MCCVRLSCVDLFYFGCFLFVCHLIWRADTLDCHRLHKCVLLSGVVGLFTGGNMPVKSHTAAYQAMHQFHPPLWLRGLVLFFLKAQYRPMITTDELIIGHVPYIYFVSWLGWQLLWVDVLNWVCWRWRHLPLRLSAINSMSWSHEQGSSYVSVHVQYDVQINTTVQCSN